MPLEAIPFGGLNTLLAPEQVPLNQAIVAQDCVIDDEAIRPRNGDRATTTSTFGSGQIQGLWRFRPLATTARDIAVQGGTVYKVTDPSTEVAKDATATSISAAFGATDNISAAQLGRYLYLASDNATPTWKRLNSSYGIESITTLSAGTIPTGTTFTPAAYTLFDTLSSPTLSGSATCALSGVGSPNVWYNIAGPIGAIATWSFGTTYNWTSTNWLFVACSPETLSGGGGSFAIEIADVGGNWTTLDTISDNPGTNGSPWGVWCSLLPVASATIAAITQIRFRQVGPTSDPFSVSGFMPLATPPAVGEVDYYVNYENSSTGQQGDLSPSFPVFYTAANVYAPTYYALQWNYNNLQVVGTQSTNPENFSRSGLWNTAAGKSSPQNSDFSELATFTFAIPTANQYPLADTFNLWQNTPNGVRLVKSVTYSTGATTITVTDDQGQNTLANLSFLQATGTPPACVAMAACNGRLVCGGDPNAPNQLTISSYLAFGATTDPFPFFPAIALQPSDGWYFDISETNSEQILALQTGDHALYIGTNEAVYFMPNLDPDSDPYLIYQKGVMSRRSMCWAESSIIWASNDGIYISKARAQPTELTQSIRSTYRSWFAPDTTIVLGYQDRKLYATRGTYQLRYDFVTETWTTHILNVGFLHSESYRDPTGLYYQLRYFGSDGLIHRWQPGVSFTDTNRATSDNGTAIPGWNYSTGFTLKPMFTMQTGYADVKTHVRSVYLDTDSSGVVASAYKDNTTSFGSTVTFGNSGEHELPFSASVVGYKWRLVLAGGNTNSVRRAMWGRVKVDSDGG